MKVVYGVKWIEVEFGQRPEGWKLYKNLDEAIIGAAEDSRNGPYNGGYCGPERPVTVFEIPWECLPQDIKTVLKTRNVTFSENWWNPKFSAPINQK